VRRVGLGEDGADDGGDHILAGTRDDGENICHEVDSAALPSGALKDSTDGLLQSAVGVGDEELGPVQTAGFQRREELSPEDLVFAIADVEPEHFPAAVGGHADGDDHRLGDDTVVDGGLAIRGVEEHVGVARHAEVASERGHFPVEIGADPRHFRLGDAGVGAEGLDQIVDFPRRDTVEVSLHDDGEQGLVNASASLEDGGEE